MFHDGRKPAWSPSNLHSSWRDWSSLEPQSSFNTSDSRVKRQLELGDNASSAASQRSKSRSKSRDGEYLSKANYPGGEPAQIPPSVWRLSFRGALSHRSQQILSIQRLKTVGQLPVFPGLDIFTLRSLGITSLRGIGRHPEVRKLFLQSNYLSSFEGWEHQPQLVELHAENNLIESFRGIKKSTTMESLWMQGNPIAQTFHYRTMAIAAIGSSLRLIDGEAVRRVELQRAKQLGKVVADAIREGWILDTIRNPEADYDISLEQYIHYRRHGAGVMQDGSERSSQASTFEDDAGEIYRDMDDHQGVRHSHSSERVPSSLTKLNPRAMALKKRASSVDRRSDRRSRSPMSSRQSRSWMSQSSSESEPEERTPVRSSSKPLRSAVKASPTTRIRASPKYETRIRAKSPAVETRIRQRARTPVEEYRDEEEDSWEGTDGERGGVEVEGRPDVQQTKKQIQDLMQQLAREGSELKWQLESLEETEEKKRREDGGRSGQRTPPHSASPRSARAWHAGSGMAPQRHRPDNSNTFDPEWDGTSSESRESRMIAAAAYRDRDMAFVDPAVEWTKVREMTSALNQDMQNLDRRMNRRRNVADMQNWIERRNNSTGEEDEEDEEERRAQARGPVRERNAHGLPSLTGGYPVTTRSLKRRVLERWSRVLEAPRRGRSPPRETGDGERGRLEQGRRSNGRRSEEAEEVDDGDEESHRQLRISAADLAAAAVRAKQAEADLLRLRMMQQQAEEEEERQREEMARTQRRLRDAEPTAAKHEEYSRGDEEFDEEDSRDNSYARDRRGEPPPVRHHAPTAEPAPQLDSGPPSSSDGGAAAASMRAQAAAAERMEMERMAAHWQAQASPEQPPAVARHPSAPTVGVEEDEEDAEEELLRRKLEEVQARKQQAKAANSKPAEPAPAPWPMAEAEPFSVGGCGNGARETEEDLDGETRTASYASHHSRPEQNGEEEVHEGGNDLPNGHRTAFSEPEAAKLDNDLDLPLPGLSPEPLNAPPSEPPSNASRASLAHEAPAQVPPSNHRYEPPAPRPSAVEAMDSTFADTTFGDTTFDPPSNIDTTHVDSPMASFSGAATPAPLPPLPPQQVPRPAEPQPRVESAQDMLDAYSYGARPPEPAPLDLPRHPSGDFQNGQESSRTDTPSEMTAADRTEDGTPAKKKKSKKAEKGASGKLVLLTNCEIKGDVVEGGKVTAFAKRVKKQEISCTFQWFRQFPNGAEVPIAGADKASYVIVAGDVGVLLKVVGIPVSKKTGEAGEPVNAVTSTVRAGASQAYMPDQYQHHQQAQQPYYPQQQAPQQQMQAPQQQMQAPQQQMHPPQDPNAAPCLADWKVEMNAKQEYVDPIRMQYVYQGGQEGKTEIEWYLEAFSNEIRGGDEFVRMAVKDPMTYTPTVDDVDKRIKILLTPVRVDGLRGPTYQHILEPLRIPPQTADEVKKCVAEFKSHGANFLVAEVDLNDPSKQSSNKRIVCDDKQLKIRNAQTNKTELKSKIVPGFLKVTAHQEINRIFELKFAPTKALPNVRPMLLVADSVHSRDIIVLVLRTLNNFGL